MAGVGRHHLGRVLVVDDDPGTRRTCARLLGTEGWTVIVAEHGRAAIEALAEERDAFDCVVSDVNMPELDGFGLISEIRRHHDDLPILLMTGDPSLDGAVRAIETGAVSYIAKPFDQETLATAVARAARRHGVARMRRRAERFAREMLGPNAGDRHEIESRFEHALATSWVAFQPIVNIRAKSIFAYEALVRTEEPSMKRPDVLIATAERLDRIHDLGRIVRGNVVRAAPSVPTPIAIFVNIHGLELTDEALFDGRGGFAELAPRIVLEITERIGLDAVAAPSRVAMLRRLGYRIAVDDLGAGYAALGALATLEPDIVKLDMSLVRDIHRQSTKRRVVGAMSTPVRELGGRVVAEGVETTFERDALLDAGIDLLQGFFRSRAANSDVLAWQLCQTRQRRSARSRALSRGTSAALRPSKEKRHMSTNQKLSSHTVWLFAFGSAAAATGATYALSGMGQKVTAAVYFAIVAIGGFASTYLTKARVRGAVLAFLTVAAISAIAYFMLVDSMFRQATTAATDAVSGGAAHEQGVQAGATFGKLFGVIVAVVVFLETTIAGITGAVIGDKTRGQGGLAAIGAASRAAS